MRSLSIACFAVAVALHATAVRAADIGPIHSESVKVFITGAVQSAGKREVSTRTTVWEAIQQAGGAEQTRSRLLVKLVRQGPDGKTSTLTLDLSGGDKSKDNLILRDHDVVFVPKT